MMKPREKPWRPVKIEPFTFLSFVVVVLVCLSSAFGCWS
jgi:hypothetical protein